MCPESSTERGLTLHPIPRYNTSMKKRRVRMPHDRQGRKMPTLAKYDAAMRRFISNIDEDAFHLALAEAPDPKFRTFLNARLDPHFRNMTFAQMCRNFGISLAEMDDLYRKSQIHLGMIRSSNHIPQLIEDIAIDAKSKQAYCTRCDGTGTVSPADERSPVGGDREDRPAAVRVCPMCHGAKEVRIPGDKSARDLVYESYGLIGKGGVQFNNQIHLSLDAELGDLLATSQKVLAGTVKEEEPE